MAYGIDAELTEEGWDVNDPDYYLEMDKDDFNEDNEWDE